MDVGVKIRHYLDSMGISQRWLSLKTGISESKLSLCLAGKRRLTFVEYQVICWVLGVGVDKFMEPIPPSGVQRA